MIEIPLTQGFVALVDDADADSVAGYSWQVLIRGREPNITRYAQTNVPSATTKSGQTSLLMHRRIMAAPPRVHVDHWDHDGLNNRRGNLRLATASQNVANSRLRRDNTSGFRGVSWNDGSWRATIIVASKRRHLGRFSGPNAAARAYDAAALEAFGEFARLNFPVNARLLGRDGKLATIRHDSTGKDNYAAHEKASEG